MIAHVITSSLGFSAAHQSGGGAEEDHSFYLFFSYRFFIQGRVPLLEIEIS